MRRAPFDQPLVCESHRGYMERTENMIQALSGGHANDQHPSRRETRHFVFTGHALNDGG